MQSDQLSLPDEYGESQSQSSASNQLSCVQCRNRKLKCDRRLPNCERCVKQNETCTYPESRQRAIGRRKTVRELEEKISELEQLLRAANLRADQEMQPDLSDQSLEQALPPLNPQGPELFGVDPMMISGQNLTFDPAASNTSQQSANQLIDLGIFEQLPSFDLIDELTAIYFQNIHAGAPILHQASYTAALRLPPHMRPPVCLQYIVMASAAATVETYRHLAEPFFRRARVYAEADELKGQGETYMTLGHAQCWCLISGYECHVYAYFTRASTSLCRSVRMAQMLKLHQVDNEETQPLSWGQPLAPARSWIETEERRRTWWVIFMADRYLSSTTGWPSLIDERLTRTNLPASEEAYAAGIEEPSVPLSKALAELEEGRGSRLSPLATRILAANELLHALDHTARLLPEDDHVEDIQHGSYWRRQREIDKNLSVLSLFLPEKLQMSRNPRNLDAILIHMSTNMAVIQLHRTALTLMREHSMPSYLITQSQARLLPAAESVLAIFRTAGDSVNAAIKNPLMSFAAYMAASVYLDDLQAAGTAAEQSQQSRDNLKFLAQIFVYFGRSSQLVRTVAFQLAADLQQAGYDSSLMEKVTEQMETLGGSISEIIKPNSKRAPMLFCPALTSMLDPLSNEVAI